MNIRYADNLGITPARVIYATGEILLNREIWDDLPGAYQDFIIAHEEGHYNIPTTNELMADHYALMKLAGTESNSLKNAVKTICDLLPGNSPVHQMRILNIYRLALLHDSIYHPQANTSSELAKLEDRMKNYLSNDHLKEYETMIKRLQKGNPEDYAFPGYHSDMFQSSVGRTFHDIYHPGTTQTEFEKKYGSNQSEDPVYWISSERPDSNQGGLPVSLHMLPSIPAKISLDLKTLMLVLLGIILFVGFQKLNA